ncbi:aminodeoxychorismate synthase component I [Piscinibacter defluvii]|uniref:aminodeoxychorismate synthase component I n=1 Tax=Piscinibacter defluvii TaxID=1796922 RepID=UPI000FDCFF7F|nr:aminodeoxychorismate synthase component I [Piscinibacter defluvii]
MDSPFVLLDDRDSSAEHPTSRLYTGFVREHRCSDPATLEAVCAALEADQRAGLHAVLLADYEWGAKLLGAGVRERDRDASLRVLMFECLERLARAQVDERLATLADEPCGTLDLHASVTGEEFGAAIARIHAAIADGETYQVNYTYRLTGRAYGEPLVLYRALRTRQPVAYGAFVALPEGACVLSLSPELFVRHAGGLATARPMKGTAGRITAPEGDSETARLLSLDVKNRAENLMIVDLLRNDLGRIAETGSVAVPELFAIEPYATVFQMTSTVQARLRPEVDLAALLRAVFPCGSITGAPKHHTMGLIAAIESTPRGLYCGAIGWLEAAPPGRRLGDLCLSVAIRTLVLGAPQADGTRPLRLGIGAGIVKDSVAADEYEECRLKARFLTGLDPGFELFETVLARGDGSLPYLERHLARLQRSAAALGFEFDRDAAREALHDAAGQGDGRPQRLRLALAKNGRLGLSRAPLAPLAEAVVDLLIAPQRLPDADPLAAHKTTRRAHYDAGVRAAEAAGAFDSLFLGADDRLVEGGRSSVFVRLDGRWWTPPLADGALPGVMRSVLLDDPAWQAAERRLDLRDLARAEALVVCNALRGVLPARLRQPAGALP